jgi:hypothetical protein
MMMRRSKKLLGRGGGEYFNEKRPVNVRIDKTHLTELFSRPRDTSYQCGSVRVVAQRPPHQRLSPGRQPFPYPITEE